MQIIIIFPFLFNNKNNAFKGAQDFNELTEKINLMKSYNFVL